MKKRFCLNKKYEIQPPNSMMMYIRSRADAYWIFMVSCNHFYPFIYKNYKYLFWTWFLGVIYTPYIDVWKRIKKHMSHIFWWAITYHSMSEIDEVHLEYFPCQYQIGNFDHYCQRNWKKIWKLVIFCGHL